MASRDPTSSPAIPAVVVLATSALRIVDTIADLKALPLASRTGVVLVLGRFVSADGDGSIWCWKEADTRDDNGTTVLLPT